MVVNVVVYFLFDLEIVVVEYRLLYRWLWNGVKPTTEGFANFIVVFKCALNPIFPASDSVTFFLLKRSSFNTVGKRLDFAVISNHHSKLNTLKPRLPWAKRTTTIFSRWWFPTFLFSPLLGEDSHFD